MDLDIVSDNPSRRNQIGRLCRTNALDLLSGKVVQADPLTLVTRKGKCRRQRHTAVLEDRFPTVVSQKSEGASVFAEPWLKSHCGS